MSSNFTQTQRDLLSNVKQAVALVDKELQRIREKRIAICLSGFELDWQLGCIGAMQSADGPNKLSSMINAHTDFQTALRVCPKSLSRITELSQHKPDGGQSKESQCIAVEILKIFGKAPAAIGRVGDWRAGLGRCLCSPLARPFVCECHKIST